MATNANVLAYQQQLQDALQDSVNTYSAAAADGVPGAATHAAQGQAALASLPQLPSLGAPTDSSNTDTAVGATATIPGLGSFSIPPALTSLVGKVLPSHGIGDYVSILIGAILVAGGIFMFRQTQTIISTGGRLASRAAEIAG
jgi:hypothetical protein